MARFRRVIRRLLIRIALYLLILWLFAKAITLLLT